MRPSRGGHATEGTIIVEHDGGWAYKVNAVFSETFPTHAEALAAAQAAAEEQEVPGHTATIEYEDDKGKWHTETASGRDRRHTVVKDTSCQKPTSDALPESPVVIASCRIRDPPYAH
jgi:hypothetical protein